MFHLIIRFSGMCVFSPVKLAEGEYAADVALLKCDGNGKLRHDPQLGKISGDHFAGRIPATLDGYDVKICDGDEPIVEPSRVPFRFPGSMPLRLVAQPCDIDDGICCDGKPQHPICGTRVRLYDGKVLAVSTTTDEWHLVDAAGKPIKGSQRFLTTEYAFVQEIESKHATLRLEKSGSKKRDLKFKPLEGANSVELVMSSPDRDWIAPLVAQTVNRSRDFGMIFSALKPGSTFTQCYLEQVNKQGSYRPSTQSTLLIPCVGPCTSC